MGEPLQAASGKSTVSIVAPCLNEEEALPLLHRLIEDTLGQDHRLSIEFVFVDDGSTDATPRVLAELCRADPRVRAVTLTRNFGHQAAVSAGLQFATGDAVIVCDADLQDSPEVMPAMVEKWRQGADVVYAVRRHREERLHYRVAYRAFYRLLSALSEIDIPLDSGDFGLMDRKVVDAINRLPERNRFVRGLRAWVGYRQVPIEYDRPARRHGATKYSLFRLMRLALDGIFDFSTKPLTVIFAIGLVASAVSLSGFVFFLAHRIIGFKVFGHTPADVPGITSVVLAVFFFGGVQLLATGVVGEYIGRIYKEVKRRPSFVVSSLAPLAAEAGPRPDTPETASASAVADQERTESSAASIVATSRPSLTA